MKAFKFLLLPPLNANFVTILTTQASLNLMNDFRSPSSKWRRNSRSKNNTAKFSSDFLHRRQRFEGEFVDKSDGFIFCHTGNPISEVVPRSWRTKGGHFTHACAQIYLALQLYGYCCCSCCCSGRIWPRRIALRGCCPTYSIIDNGRWRRQSVSHMRDLVGASRWGSRGYGEMQHINKNKCTYLQHLPPSCQPSTSLWKKLGASVRSTLNGIGCVSRRGITK